MDERVAPMTLTYNGVEYTLDFTRDTVRNAERAGFKLSDVTDYPTTKIPELFWRAFQAKHRNMARNKTDAILEAMGGLAPAHLERLILLYNQASLAGVFATDDEVKNSEVTVVL